MNVYDGHMNIIPGQVAKLALKQMHKLLSDSGVECAEQWIDTTNYSGGGHSYGGVAETGYFVVNERDIEAGCHDYVIEHDGTVTRTKDGFAVNGKPYTEVAELVETVLSMPSARRVRVSEAIAKYERTIEDCRATIASVDVKLAALADNGL